MQDEDYQQQQLETRHQAVTRHLHHARSNIQPLADALQAAINEYNLLEAEFNGAAAIQNQLRVAALEAENAREATQTLADNLRRELDQTSFDLKESRREEEKSSETISILNSQVAAFMKQVAQLEEDIGIFTNSNANLRADLADTTDELEATRQYLEEEQQRSEILIFDKMALLEWCSCAQAMMHDMTNSLSLDEDEDDLPAEVIMKREEERVKLNKRFELASKNLSVVMARGVPRFVGGGGDNKKKKQQEKEKSKDKDKDKKSKGAKSSKQGKTPQRGDYSGCGGGGNFDDDDDDDNNDQGEENEEVAADVSVSKSRSAGIAVGGGQPIVVPSGNNSSTTKTNTNTSNNRKLPHRGDYSGRGGGEHFVPNDSDGTKAAKNSGKPSVAGPGASAGPSRWDWSGFNISLPFKSFSFSSFFGSGSKGGDSKNSKDNNNGSNSNGSGPLRLPVPIAVKKKKPNKKKEPKRDEHGNVIASAADDDNYNNSNSSSEYDDDDDDDESGGEEVMDDFGVSSSRRRNNSTRRRRYNANGEEIEFDDDDHDKNAAAIAGEGGEDRNRAAADNNGEDGEATSATTFALPTRQKRRDLAQDIREKLLQAQQKARESNQQVIKLTKTTNDQAVQLTTLREEQLNLANKLHDANTELGDMKRRVGIAAQRVLEFARDRDRAREEAALTLQQLRSSETKAKQLQENLNLRTAELQRARRQLRMVQQAIDDNEQS